MYEVRIRDVPAQWVVTEQRTVTQRDLQAWLPQAMARVAAAAAEFGGVALTSSMPFLDRAGYAPEQVFIVIYEGNPNDGPVPVEACAPVVTGRNHPATRLVPAHRAAYVRLTKAQTEPTTKISAAYDAVELWVYERDLEVADAPREVYYTDYHAAGADDPVFDVAWPIRQPIR